MEIDPTFGPLSLAPLDCGTSPNTVGVFAASENAAGISGASEKAEGVFGRSLTKAGVYGRSDTFDAVVGETYSDAHAGVTGRNLSRSPGPGAVGIYGVGGQHAGKFDGHVQINGDADITGTLNVHKDITMPNADFAEEFDIADSNAEPGTVMVLDDDGALRPSEQSYDRRVAGVISGAGDYRPALILDKQVCCQARRPIALVGKVYCKADASCGPIGVGDMLTSSPTLGHAMKVNDVARAFGAVIGKALAPLRDGRGLIPILIALQ